ncbi:MAG: hypothetical protein MPN21_19925 [Thermoanaerobaculia bacterium]|nr:hypothetical protein [Thermoanaerobaculia bacterium]
MDAQRATCRGSLALGLLLAVACSSDPVAIPVDRSAEKTEESAQSESGPARILTPPLGPKPSVEAEPELLESIRTFLPNGGRRVSCGPYSLWTDVRDPSLLVALDVLASRLDTEYQARLGLTPQGPSRETIVLFANLRDFQRWESADDGSRRGYAGHSSASEGVAVLHADRPPEDVLATTIHELAHLVHRRALGSPLPRWLSEGLADALADSASGEGFLPLDSVVGDEGGARRLQSALRAGHAVPSLAELVAKGPASFDRVSPNSEVRTSYDYELSAFFVRFLLVQPDLVECFKGFLAELAAGGRWSEDSLWLHLDQHPEELDERFRRWLLE